MLPETVCRFAFHPSALLKQPEPCWRSRWIPFLTLGIGEESYNAYLTLLDQMEPCLLDHQVSGRAMALPIGLTFVLLHRYWRYWLHYPWLDLRQTHVSRGANVFDNAPQFYSTMVKRAAFFRHSIALCTITLKFQINILNCPLLQNTKSL